MALAKVSTEKLDSPGDGFVNDYYLENHGDLFDRFFLWLISDSGIYSATVIIESSRTPVATNYRTAAASTDMDGGGQPGDSL